MIIQTKFHIIQTFWLATLHTNHVIYCLKQCFKQKNSAQINSSQSFNIHSQIIYTFMKPLTILENLYKKLVISYKIKFLAQNTHQSLGFNLMIVQKGMLSNKQVTMQWHHLVNVEKCIST